jgi:hypothetical protein
MSRVRALAVLGFLLCIANTFAWDDFGHMTVAAIAYQRLTPAARTKVDALLKLNPEYGRWVAGVSEENRDRIAFIMAATWADAIKRDRRYQNDGDFPQGPDAARNIGYKDRLQHRYWHYIDLPFSPDGTKLKRPAAPNAQTQIAAFRKALASPGSSDDVKSYDLVWLLHLVGDVHQPLHATSRFDRDQPNGDRGGNEVALCAPPCKEELHLFWDNVLGTQTNSAAAIRKAAALPPVDANLAAIVEESVWIDESFRAAQRFVYAAPIGVGAGPFILNAQYKADARWLASQRIALAGARLAILLNEALK